MQTIPYVTGTATATTSCAGLTGAQKKQCQKDKAAAIKLAKQQQRDRSTISPTGTPVAPTTFEQATTNAIGVISQVLDSVGANQRQTDLRLQTLQPKNAGGFSLMNADGGPNFLAIALVAVLGYFGWRYFFK